VKGKAINKPSELVPALEWAFAENEPILLDIAVQSTLR
jgi:thiamine pyrophosphate-dependent acetolactate synthase large subunit-like protein